MRNFLLGLLLAGSCYGVTVTKPYSAIVVNGIVSNAEQIEIFPNFIQATGAGVEKYNSIYFKTNYYSDVDRGYNVTDITIWYNQDDTDVYISYNHGTGTWVLNDDDEQASPYQNDSDDIIPPRTGWYTNSAGWGDSPTFTYLNYEPTTTYPQPSTNGVPSVDLSGFDAQAYPFTNSVWQESGLKPLIAEHTRQAAPGDTIALTGHWLNSDTKFIVSDDSGDTFVADPLVLAGESQAAITLTNALDPNEMYMCWPSNSHNVGQPFAINKTEAWWIGPDNVESGKTFSVYGRNLNLDGTNFLYIAEISQWMTNYAGNPYKADFVADLAPGNYTVWAHNGKGREYGWSDSLTLTVVSPIAWDSGSTQIVVNVSGDDKSSILSAISTAEAGDTIYFTNGTYEVSGTINVTKDNIRFLGESINAIITSAVGYSGSELIDISGRDGLKFQNLSIDSGTNMSDITPLVDMNNLSDSVFDNVSFSVEKHPDQSESKDNTIELQYGVGITFTNCSFILGGSINQIWSEQTFYQNCRFYGVNHCSLFINSGRGIETSITGCSLENYDESDPDSDHTYAVGRFYHANVQTGKSSDVYFGGNSTTNICPRDGYGNQNGEGEHYLVDISTTRYRGVVIDAGQYNVTFSTSVSANSIQADRLVATVVYGKGFGQTRDLVSYSGNSATISTAWSVIPEPGSVILIGTTPIRHTIYNNYFDGTDYSYSNPNNRSLGVNFYGSGCDIIVDGNVFHELRKGVEIARLQSAIGSQIINRPLYFNTFANNTCNTVRVGINTMIEKGAGAPTIHDTAAFGNVFRNNYITNSQHVAIWHRIYDYDTVLRGEPLDMFIYDGNKISNWSNDLLELNEDKVRPSLRNFIYIGNTTNGVSWNP